MKDEDVAKRLVLGKLAPVGSPIMAQFMPEGRTAKYVGRAKQLSDGLGDLAGTRTSHPCSHMVLIVRTLLALHHYCIAGSREGRQGGGGGRTRCSDLEPRGNRRHFEACRLRTVASCGRLAEKALDEEASSERVVGWVGGERQHLREGGERGVGAVVEWWIVRPNCRL